MRCLLAGGGGRTYLYLIPTFSMSIPAEGLGDVCASLLRQNMSVSNPRTVVPSVRRCGVCEVCSLAACDTSMA